MGYKKAGKNNKNRKKMENYKITIKSGKQTLYKELHGFTTLQEAQAFSTGLCEAFRLSGMNPNRMILKQFKE